MELNWHTCYHCGRAYSDVEEICPVCGTAKEIDADDELIYFGDHDDTMPGYINPAEDN